MFSFILFEILPKSTLIVKKLKRFFGEDANISTYDRKMVRKISNGGDIQLNSKPAI